MKNEKFNDLICPDCRKKLLFQESVLHCPTCKKTFFIEESIPLFYHEDIIEKHLTTEYRYWNKKEHTAENLYENIPNSTYQKLIDIFDIPNNTKGIEIGCGDAPFARRLKSRNLNIYGIDISVPLLKLTENMIPVQGNALKLPFKDRFFHWAIYAFSLHHIPDIRKALEEALRIIDRDAKICIIEPNYYHPIRFLTRKPDTFLRKHVFTYLSPNERWIPLFKIKKILRENHIVLNKELFITPEFNSSTVSGKVQRILGNIFDFWPVKMFVESYYVVIGTKTM